MLYSSTFIGNDFVVSFFFYLCYYYLGDIMTFNYKLDDENYIVDVVKKNNKNTYIKVKEDLTIYVTTNYLVTKRYVKNVLDNNIDFLRKTINKVKNRIEKDKDFYYLGKKYDIIYSDFNKVEEDRLYFKNESSLNKWLKKQMIYVFSKRLKYNYDLFSESIPFPKLKIRSMKTRWGVCNKRDNSVTLNSKLIKYSLNEIDYVIIHELSHFVHFDHSREFWNTVEKYMPCYKKAVKVLKE